MRNVKKISKWNMYTPKNFFPFVLFIVILLAICFGIGLVMAQPTATGIKKHQSAGVSCQGCHTETPPSNVVPDNQCLICHGDLTLLVEKTNKVYPNPHASPHLEPSDMPKCSDCHHMHKPSTVSCSQCHPEFKFNVK